VLVVFTGPSLDAEAVSAALPEALVAPPACRGDVDQALAQGATGILLIDGGFAHRLAVPPSELVRALRAGVAVVGAASLGAIRAAECHPAGMGGVGAVQRLYRLRVLTDDDEVAVATEPDRGFRASSVALINIRFALLSALRGGLLDRAGAAATLAAAKRLHFSERLWDPILDAAGVGDSGALRALCHATDIKRRDAERAVAALAGSAQTRRALAPIAADSPGSATPHADLRPSAAVVAPAELSRWLAGSGRYRRYWTEPPVDPDRACSDLRARGQLDHELMRWQAVRRGMELAPDGARGPEPLLARARLARAHGYADWPDLCTAATTGHLPSGVALGQVSDAARQIALARAGLGPRMSGLE
jgi:hypothetical protein